MAWPLKVERHPPAYYLDRIRNGEVFSTSRFGDGEWNTVLRPDVNRKNCDGHRMYPAMAVELRAALRKQRGYIFGMQNFAMRLMGTGIREFLAQRNLRDIVWHDADTLAMHRLGSQGKLFKLFNALKDANVLMVGPAHLRTLKKRGLVNFLKFIEVPEKNAYDTIGKTGLAIRDAYSKLPKPLVISISCGMPAGVLVDRLFPTMGHDAFLLDMGAVYDAHCGRLSRGYMRTKR